MRVKGNWMRRVVKFLRAGPGRAVSSVIGGAPRSGPRHVPARSGHLRSGTRPNTPQPQLPFQRNATGEPAPPSENPRTNPVAMAQSDLEADHGPQGPGFNPGFDPEVLGSVPGFESVHQYHRPVTMSAKETCRRATALEKDVAHFLETGEAELAGAAYPGTTVMECACGHDRHLRASLLKEVRRRGARGGRRSRRLRVSARVNGPGAKLRP